ncbi:hypothetical protein ACI65C_013767 [Semiaphis heraclei]
MHSNSNFLHKDIVTENDDSAQDNESSNDEEEWQFGGENKVVNNLANIEINNEDATNIFASLSSTLSKNLT